MQEWAMAGGLEAALAGIFGLLIGSFLNVVVYRIPRMMELQWEAECAAYAAGTQEPAPAPQRCTQKKNSAAVASSTTG